jgi:hypothetical protein
MRQWCKRPQDRDLGPIAVDVVRRFGGVLEHPRGSKLWDWCLMARPGRGFDMWGGWTLAVEQVSWGHACRKPTWLYIVGVTPSEVTGIRTGGEPTHQIWGSRTPGRNHRCDLKAAHAAMRRRTPPAFAEWLIALARRCRVAHQGAA